MKKIYEAIIYIGNSKHLIFKIVAKNEESVREIITDFFMKTSKGKIKDFNMEITEILLDE